MKKVIIAVILTAIICISGTVLAVNQINASQITYTDSNNHETTVDDALNNLYTTQTTTIQNLNNQLNAPLDVYLSTESYSANYNGITNYRNYTHNNSWLGKYSKIKYVSVETNDYTALCKLYAVKKSDSTSAEISVGTVLDASQYMNIYVVTKSNTDGKGSKCSPRVQFYN